jgi:hypothetical protein
MAGKQLQEISPVQYRKSYLGYVSQPVTSRVLLRLCRSSDGVAASHCGDPGLIPMGILKKLSDEKSLLTPNLYVK